MRLCSMCGGVVPDNSAFCQGCGARYEGAVTNQPPQAGQVGASSQGGVPHIGQSGSFPQGGAPMGSQSGAFAPGVVSQTAGPIMHLKTNRSLVKYILLSIITLGIYAIIFLYYVSEDLNTIAWRYDKKKTMNYVLILFLLGPITLGIASYVWWHKMSDRVGSELNRRRIDYNFGAGTYWMFFGAPSLIYIVVYIIWLVQSVAALTISPIVVILGLIYLVLACMYMHKLCEALNLLSENYNVNG